MVLQNHICLSLSLSLLFFFFFFLKKKKKKDCPTSTCESIREDDGNGRCISLLYWAKGAHGWLLVNYWDELLGWAMVVLALVHTSTSQSFIG